MSKYVKNLITEHLRRRLQGIDEALLVNLVGLDANATNRLRTELQQKNIRVMLVKNSLAVRAAAGTSLAPLFDGVAGSAAICWGGGDIVALAKEVTRLALNPRFAPFAAVGGVLDGEKLAPDRVWAVSKWPSREEQLSILAGQILAPGAVLAAQIGAAGGTLAGQIKQLGGEEEGAPAPEGAQP